MLPIGSPARPTSPSPNAVVTALPLAAAGRPRAGVMNDDCRPAEISRGSS